MLFPASFFVRSARYSRTKPQVRARRPAPITPSQRPRRRLQSWLETCGCFSNVPSEMAALEFREPPPKNHCFVFNAPKDASCGDIIGALEDVVGKGSLDTLQRQGGSRFCAAVANAEAATKLSSRGAIVVNGISTPVACLDSRIVYVTVYRLLQCITDEDLAAALAPYGKVLVVQPPNFQGRRQAGNGTRLVRIQLQRPIPNFMSVLGCRVQCEYKGVKRVCYRCELEGHMGRQCPTPWCELCWASGHDTSSCPASSGRRGRARATTAECVETRSCGAGSPESETDLPDDIIELQKQYMLSGMERHEGVATSPEDTAVSKSSEQETQNSFSRDLPTGYAPTPDKSPPLQRNAVRGRRAKKKASNSAAIVQ